MDRSKFHRQTVLMGLFKQSKTNKEEDKGFLHQITRKWNKVYVVIWKTSLSTFKNVLVLGDKLAVPFLSLNLIN